jgi:hypothetical protein
MLHVPGLTCQILRVMYIYISGELARPSLVCELLFYTYMEVRLLF